MAYCVKGDLYAFGLPRGALPNPARLASSALASTDAVTLDQHGFSLNDLVSFRADDRAGGVMPAPLVAGVAYFAIPLTDDTFQVAATLGGPRIDLYLDASKLLVIAPLQIDAAIAWADRSIDEMIPAHAVPLVSPIPEMIRMTSAELAAGKLLSVTGGASKSLADTVDAAQKRLARWSAGLPVRGAQGQTPTNLAASASVPYFDSVGWRRSGGIG